MGNFDKDFIETLCRQSWSLYGVGMIVIALRLYARARKLGILQYQADDWLMIMAGALYTVLIVTLNAIARGGGSNLYPPELEGTFTPEIIQMRKNGSKVVLVSEQAMLNLIYVLKSCMLLMFARLTLGLQHDKRLVNYLAVYVATGWLASQITFFAACRPFHGYWAVPPPNPQCTTLEHYAIVQGCFNISSDLLMLGIPIPLVVRMCLPWRQKIVLMVFFSLGIFVILAALLTKVFNLTDVYSPKYMLWYVREASVAVFVANLPMIWPLLRQWFPFLCKLTPGDPPRPSKSSRGTRSKTGGAGSSSTAGSSTRWLGRVASRARRSGAGAGDERSGGQSRHVERERTPSPPCSSPQATTPNTTAAVSGRTTRVEQAHAGDGGGGGEDDGRRLLAGEIPTRGGGKEPFIVYDDIEMALTELDDDHCVDSRRLNDEESQLSGSAVSVFDGIGNNAAAFVYPLAPPARAVTKIEPGTRVKIQAAGSLATVAEPSARDAGGGSNNRPFKGGGIQVQTTFGVHGEDRGVQICKQAPMPWSPKTGNGS